MLPGFKIGSNQFNVFFMKKLQLKALQLGAKEVLSRAQLKNVLGGSGSGGSGSKTCTLRCDQDKSASSTVSDCARTTVSATCGSDLSKAVCVCS